MDESPTHIPTGATPQSSRTWGADAASQLALLTIPADQVAQQPLASRSDARMLVYRLGATPSIEDSLIRTLPQRLPQGSVLILNDTQVIPARVPIQTGRGRRGEVFLLRPDLTSGAGRQLVLGFPKRKILDAGHVIFPDGQSGAASPCDSTDLNPSGLAFWVDLPVLGKDLLSWLDQVGKIPLPPYIDRPPSSLDSSRYQTTFARHLGSVAAPTAGLHFSQTLLHQLQRGGIIVKFITLHVGGGTFLPMRSRDPTQHSMHPEAYCVPEETRQAVRSARLEGRPVIAVGTTTFRCIEDYDLRSGFEDGAHSTNSVWHETSLFLYPRDTIYCSRILSGLITNFHQPDSTLILLVASLIGTRETLTMYQHAIDRGYRFFSYGDANYLDFASVALSS